MRSISNNFIEEYLSIYDFPEQILFANQHKIGRKLMTELEKILKIKPIGLSLTGCCR
jgi:hypothetical protein